MNAFPHDFIFAAPRGGDARPGEKRRVASRGGVVFLARQAGRSGVGSRLDEALDELERSKLAAEGTLCRESMPEGERGRVRSHRSPETARWSLVTMGWFSAEAVRGSRMKRRFRPASAARAGARDFGAANRQSRVSRALHITPIPPPPSFSIIP